MNETDLSTEHAQAGQDPRISQEDVDQGGSGRHSVPSGEGAPPAVRVTTGVSPIPSAERRPGRIRSRRAFEAIRSQGQRGRSGPLSVSYLEQRTWSGPHVAYAIGRHVGPAVVRNRLRRRLRAIVAEGSHELPPGAYVVRSSSDGADLGFSELRVAMSRAVDKATNDRRPPVRQARDLPEELR
jgi:ribonuclease P protein component